MCPNCLLNQVGLDPGLYVAFGICGIFFVMGVFAMLWAFKNGEFENMEDTKFEMLDDDESNLLANNARTAVQRLRDNQLYEVKNGN